jgi:hypothetical protein
MKKPERNQHSNIGPIVGTMIIVIVLIAIALYVFASHINRQALLNGPTSTGSSASPSNDWHSDDIQTLQNDLNNALK